MVFDCPTRRIYSFNALDLAMRRSGLRQTGCHMLSSRA